MSGYNRALWLAGVSVPCAVVAAVIYRFFVPGDWDYQAGQITGAAITYIMLRLNRPAPLMTGRTGEYEPAKRNGARRPRG